MNTIDMMDVMAENMVSERRICKAFIMPSKLGYIYTVDHKFFGVNDLLQINAITSRFVR